MDYSQYKGRPFQVISKLKVRYTGIFQDIDQESQTICLSEVYNHGTEDRETPRALPGSSASLGWVRFHTNSIDSLALVENYNPPANDDQPVDPILASVSKSGPSQPNRSGPSAPAGLPPKPAGTNSANAALDRVQKSLNDLSVDGGRRRRAQAPAVPDTEFDFSKGNERFQQERQALKAANSDLERTKSKEPETVEVGELDESANPHASVVAKEEEPAAPAPKPQGKTASYKKADFFDNISADSSRVSRADERHRNYDTFGEAGGPGQQGGGQRWGGGGRGGQRGGRGGGRGGQRGGSGGSGGQRGFGHSQQGFVHTQ
ncbi:hypothetical protein Q8F55_005736 [Vanrija albida]|uniref:DFDF domain-containing protein n=1 Tax=Vanrija albida TaxID=181172 RepID=A0ABR3Q3A2_9TREE